ncbi:hypothetical protein EW145_g8066 [Phellinidium pouzarii]|uniref:Pyridoxal phosphate homeostasis protein n=1 Tax=Phellinidium pouzarii TaxID=167371 RepID=A0A4S4KAD3_9AGAM|nr:hypothetical protein EW145_g8066 [Phellinidium pouzarii]
MASTSFPSAPETSDSATPERTADLAANLAEIRERVNAASLSRKEEQVSLLVAVSKYKPAADVQVCYEQGQFDFGENYVQELVDKAKKLPQDIRWHFIGTLQSNKAKLLASIPNLYSMQTLASPKTADALNNALPEARLGRPLNVLLQVNTSGEASKAGLSPLSGSDPDDASSELVSLAKHVITRCPRLRLQGLMTIGSLAESLSGAEENVEAAMLRNTRDRLEQQLRDAFPDHNSKTGSSMWGDKGRLLLSMGMSSDFEAALRTGSDIVRIGTSIFGERHRKGET